MIFILTGAGISAESGIQTFRSDTGLWEEHRVEDVATPEGFRKDPGLVHRFYDARFAAAAAAEPNAAHIALARLQAARSDVTIVTQNVDDLHERAGSTGVIHMHGALADTICSGCGALTAADGKLATSPPCPVCGSKLRPDITWFGEMPKHMEAIGAALRAAKTFIAIGTSGNVYPAADFARVARNRKARCIEFNLERTEGSRMFVEHRRGPASKTVPAYVDEVLRG